MSETLPPDTHKVVNEFTSEQTSHAVSNVGQPVIDLLNAYSQEHDQMLAIYGGLYALGCALANIGAALEEPADLRVCLSPLLHGYEDSLAQEKH